MLTSKLLSRSAETVSYITNVSNTASGTSYTFTGASIGGPGLIVLCIHAGQGSATNYTVTSCTIGGVAANIHVNPLSTDGCAIASLVVTSGTTANIVVNLSTTVARCLVGIFRVTGYVSATPYSTASTTTGTGGVRTVALNTSANGILIAGSSHSDTTTYTWTNATERYDSTIGGLSNTFSGADSTTVGGSVTITATTADTAPSNGYTLSAASWR